jgi:hypothetical protein
VPETPIQRLCRVKLSAEPCGLCRGGAVAAVANVSVHRYFFFVVCFALLSFRFLRQVPTWIRAWLLSGVKPFRGKGLRSVGVNSWSDALVQTLGRRIFVNEMLLQNTWSGPCCGSENAIADGGPRSVAETAVVDEDRGYRGVSWVLAGTGRFVAWLVGHFLCCLVAGRLLLGRAGIEHAYDRC